MSWIEGVGDEVTITITIFFGLIVLLLAWFSTGIRDIPFISVIIVQFTRRRARNQNADQTPVDEAVSERSHNETEHTGSDGVSEIPAQPSSTEEPQASGGVESVETSAEIAPETPATATIKDGNSQNGLYDENIQATIVKQTEVELNTQNTHLENDLNTCNKDGNSVNKKGENSTIDDTEVTSLSEQEIRQKRLEFFIGGSSQSIVDSQRIESHIEDAENNKNENTSSQVSDSSSPAQSDFIAPSDSESQTGSSVDPVNESRTNPTTETQSSDSQSSEDEIRVKIKFFNDEQRLVTSSPTETIGNFRRRHFSTELSESKLVRFIFNGQDLRNDASTLQSHNIMDNSVLHCLVTQPQQTERPNTHEDEGLDMGVFMFPLFGVLLGIVWYMRFMYRQFFNVTSTLTLGGITFLYLAAFLSSFRAQRHVHLD